MKNFKLYIIIDRQICQKRDLKKIVKQVLRAGADIIQLRDKISETKNIIITARILKKIIHQKKALFIINDRVDIARVSDCDGVHLGQNDLSLGWARSILGRNKIIGISCHNLKQAREAEKQGADYISIGPVFATPLKSKYKPIGVRLIKKMKKSIKIPFLVIGGINISNINTVLAAGAERIALCRAVCKVDNPYAATKKIKDILEGFLN